LGSGVALVYSSAASSYTAPRLLSCSSATPPFSTTAFQQAMPLGSCPTGADSVLVGMWHDLPETPRQEEQLRRAKVAAEATSDAKSIVLRNMRHEICTPMHAPNSPRWRGEARQEQSKIDSQRPSALPRASRTFGSALSLKRSMYYQPETYRHAQEDKAPGTCIKEGPSDRAIRGCWVAGLLGCWEANSNGMLWQIIPHRVSNVIEFTHTVVTHQLLHCTPHVLLLLLHYSSILQTGPPARQGFQVRLTCALPEVSAGWGEVGGEMGVGGVGGGGEGRGGGGMDLQEANRAALYQPSVPALSYVRWQFVSGPPASILCAIPYVKLFCYFLIRTDLAIIDSQSLPLEGVNTLFPLPSGGREYSLPPSLWRA
ncbi:unnamed protein product, partial [Closterium sp. NIES-65]